MYVCICHAVTETDVRAAVTAGDRSAADVADRTGASTGCGTCTDRLCAVVDAILPAASDPMPVSTAVA